MIIGEVARRVITHCSRLFEARQKGDQNLMAQVQQSTRRLTAFHLGGMSLDRIKVTRTSMEMPGE